MRDERFRHTHSKLNQLAHEYAKDPVHNTIGLDAVDICVNLFDFLLVWIFCQADNCGILNAWLGDIKSENILLTKDLDPRIADLGEARAMARDQAMTIVRLYFCQATTR